MAGGLVKTALNGVKATGLNIGDGMNIVFGVADYNAAREEGDSVAMSAAKAVGSFAWGEFFQGGIDRAVTKGLSRFALKPIVTTGLSMGASIGISVLMASGEVINAMGEHTAKITTKGYSQRGRFGSGHFEMSEAGYTMRQRSLNAIRSNGLNTQSVLGNEARTYFRGSM
jgi:hypothetical protein